MRSQTFPVIIANLQTMRDFLEKLVGVCEDDPLYAKVASEADRQAVQAMRMLAQTVSTVLARAEQGYRQNVPFHAHDVLTEALGGAVLPPRDNGPDVQRMRVVMDMCLQKGDEYRQQVFALSSEIVRLRAALRDVHAQLQDMQACLHK